MARALANRLSKLETIASPPPPVPHVVKVQHGETKAEAMARFNALFAGRRRHGLLVVPARVTEQNRDQWKAGFKARSIRLVEEARSKRIEEGNNDNDYARHYAQPRTQERRILSKPATADAVNVNAWKPRQLRR